jgi:basic membrane protein A
VDIPQVTVFLDGFALGVDYYNKKNGTSVELRGWNIETRNGLFAGDFCCAARGREATNQLLDQGADVIFPVAGTDVGAGALYAVKTHGEAYLIGVDNDWAATHPEYASIILTSVMKHSGVSVVEAVKALEGGTFTGGLHIGTLDTGEVGLAPFYQFNGLVSAKIKADLEQIENDIIAGGIRTLP